MANAVKQSIWGVWGILAIGGSTELKMWLGDSIGNWIPFRLTYNTPQIHRGNQWEQSEMSLTLQQESTVRN